ncbi:MAG TPA: copper transporter [Actinotalea sp.]|nr:copper transporter [Actinotalea sp.]
MIDFRYHLVSLISVFLALAVGIALGAGPLKESIGDTLTGQVDQLRAEKDELSAQVLALQADLDQTSAALSEIGPSLVQGTLGGRRVALVVLDSVDEAVVSGVSTVIGRAGGSVTGVATVTEAWTDPTRSAFRQSLASTLLGYLAVTPPEDASVPTQLAEVLAQGLTTADPTDPDVLSADAAILLELLGGDSGLVTFGAEVRTPADVVVVLAGPVLPAGGLDQPTPAPTLDGRAAETLQPGLEDPAVGDARVEGWLQIAIAAQRRSAGTVVVTGQLDDPGLVAQIRQDPALAAELSTVDDLLSPAGTASVPLALANRVAGTVGHFGRGAGTTAAIPSRVALPQVERFPAAPPDDLESPPDGTTEQDPPADGQDG